jgi:type II secretory pathway component PulF
MLEEQDEMNRLVRSAMAYPVMVVIALSTAILILLTFVVPKFAGMFEQRGVDLPVLTQILITIGQSFRSFWWAYLLTTAASVFTFNRLWRDPNFRTRIDKYLARVPYLSRLLRALALTRFANVFGLSLSSGIGLLDSLEMGGRASARPVLIEDVDVLMEQVKRGGKLSEVLRSCKYITPFVRQLLSAGEESAEMSRMCKIISTHYARESPHLAKNAATIVEPILIAGLTVIVLVVALAIFIPMWDMVSLV